MKIAFLTRYGYKMGSSRVRVHNYLPYLEAMGFDCRVLCYPSSPDPRTRAGYLRRAANLARWADLLVLQRVLLKEYQMDLLRRLSRSVVFDFDDALYAPPDSTAGDPCEQRMYHMIEERLAKVLSWSDGVIAGSEYLAGYASRFNERVFVIPSPVDTGIYYPRAGGRDRTRRTVVGWIGSPESARDFMALGDPDMFLEALRGEAVLKVVGARPPWPESTGVICEQWSLEGEMEQLRSFDVGIMPLNDTERTRGRCSYKAIQYMGMGIPVVASPVGAAPEVVVDGSTGIMAETSGEWAAAMRLLLRDDRKREEMGAAGYRKAREKYSYEVNAPALAEVFRRARKARD